MPDDLLLDQVGGWLERVDVSAPSSSGDPFMVELRSRVDQDLEDAALGLGTIPVKVTYIFPLVFITATLLGAMLGSAIFVYAPHRGRARRGLLAVDWAIGVLVGVGVTALLYAGFQLPKFLPSIPEHSTRTIVPFALAFVAAAMGASLILHWTGRRVE